MFLGGPLFFLAALNLDWPERCKLSSCQWPLPYQAGGHTEPGEHSAGKCIKVAAPNCLQDRAEDTWAAVSGQPRVDLQPCAGGIGWRAATGGDGCGAPDS
jgi:hypothetical protein